MICSVVVVMCRRRGRKKLTSLRLRLSIGVDMSGSDAAQFRRLVALQSAPFNVLSSP
jgi:hypothetical protein